MRWTWTLHIGSWFVLDAKRLRVKQSQGYDIDKSARAAANGARPAREEGEA